MAEKYRVTLTAEERDELIRMTTTGKAAAAKLRHARILLKADASTLGPDCTDKEIATACEGQARWTLKLLADRLVELEIVEAVSAETVRRTLKKTTSSRG